MNENLWNAINKYAVSCGGDTSKATISHRHMIAERIEALSNGKGYSGRWPLS